MKYLVGIDPGTSGVKCLIIDEDGKVVRYCYEDLSAVYAEAGMVGAGSGGLVERNEGGAARNAGRH